MASLLVFISSYPYHQYPQNPTIRGRGDGRGRVSFGHADHIGHRGIFWSVERNSVRVIAEFSGLENRRSANRDADAMIQ